MGYSLSVVLFVSVKSFILRAHHSHITELVFAPTLQHSPTLLHAILGIESTFDTMSKQEKHHDATAGNLGNVLYCVRAIEIAIVLDQGYRT